MRNRSLFRRTLLGLIAALACLPAAGNDARDVHVISEHMSHLRSLIGTWAAIAEFRGEDGSTTYETGTYRIAPVLDGTYLQWDVTFRRRDDPSRTHSFLIFLTYNPVTAKYESVYLYSRWALRVSESGDYDPASKELRTTAFIPKEDGVHDENVRTITRLGSGDDVEYLHFSRMSHQAAERKDLVIRLTRVRG